MDKKLNILMWLMMSALFGYFAYTKGWIIANFQNVSILEGKSLIDKDENLTLLDVRSAREYQRDCIASSINIPFHELEQNLSRVLPFKATKILIYSERGERGVKASRLLSKAGFVVSHLNGGVIFWIRQGYKVRKP